MGRAIAEAVSRWLPTVAARVQSLFWSSGICGEQSGVGAGFLRVLRFPLPFIPPNSPSSQSPEAGTNRPRLKWPTCRVDPVWTPPPTMQIKKKNLHLTILILIFGNFPPDIKSFMDISRFFHPCYLFRLCQPYLFDHPNKISLKSTDYNVLNYAVFSSFTLIHLREVQIACSEPCSHSYIVLDYPQLNLKS
jgi:hypothetical protein